MDPVEYINSLTAGNDQVTSVDEALSFMMANKRKIALVKKACADRAKLLDQWYFEYRSRESRAILKKKRDLDGYNAVMLENELAAKAQKELKDQEEELLRKDQEEDELLGSIDLDLNSAMKRSATTTTIIDEESGAKTHSDKVLKAHDIQSVVVKDGDNGTVALSSKPSSTLILDFAKKDEQLVSTKILEEVNIFELVGPDGEDIIVSAENEGVVGITGIGELEDTFDAVEELFDEKKGEPKSGKKSVVPKSKPKDRKKGKIQVTEL